MSPEITAVPWGDFSSSATHIEARPRYASQVVQALARVAIDGPDATVADVGAGTGKFTLELQQLGLRGFAIEPNDSMFHAGSKGPTAQGFKWIQAFAEDTTLQASSVDWVCMSNAFHWARLPDALHEFRRVLRPGKWFTAIWNLRDLDHDSHERDMQEFVMSLAPTITYLHFKIEEYISQFRRTVETIDGFSEIFYIEGPTVESMSRDRYVANWKAVHDIPSQVSPEKWAEIQYEIEKATMNADSFRVGSMTRAWSLRRDAGV